MNASSGEAWAGLAPEGARMSAVAVLRRLAALAGGKRPLAVLAPRELLGVVADAARQEGWERVEPAEAEAVLQWGGAAEVAMPRAKWICRIVREAAPELAWRGFGLRKSLPFRGYVSVNQVFGRLAGKLGLPAAACARVSRLWEAWGLAAAIGGKMALLAVKGWRETHWVAGNCGAVASPRGRWGEVVRDGVATFGGIGHVPLAGALLASLVTALAGWLSWEPLAGSGLDWFRAVWASVALASIWGCLWTERWAAEHFLAPDPREVVLDETAGMAMVMLFLPERLISASPGVVAACFGVGFVAFRLFDMLKVGVRWVECTGWRGSIVWDDVLAGIYAGGITWLLAQRLALGS